MVNIFNTEKSIGGYVKKFTTSLFFNKIKFYLAARRRTFFLKLSCKISNYNPKRLPYAVQQSSQ